MKLLNEYFIQEVTYKYDNETSRDFHKKHMLCAGFIVGKNIWNGNNPLVVTYQKRQLNDRMPRL